MPGQAKSNNLNCYSQGTHSLSTEIHAKMSVVCVGAGYNGNTDRTEVYIVLTQCQATLGDPH